jgi:hypothetical protein
MCIFFALKMLEKKATGETFTMLCLEGMTANNSWLPHLRLLRDDKNEQLNIDYGNLKAPIPFGVTQLTGIYFQVNFQFNDITLKAFITEINRRVTR